MLTSHVIWNNTAHEWCEGREFNDRTCMFRALDQKDLGNTISLTPMCTEVIVDIRFDMGCWERDVFRAGMLCDLAHQMGKKCYLKLWYVPNARMDRIKDDSESFSLRTFARLLNAIGFDTVYVFDPHSDVTPALIDNCKVLTAEKFQRRVFWEVGQNYGVNPTIVFPDAGAAHRYDWNDKEMMANTVIGIKHRNWDTSYIDGFTFTNPERFEDGVPVIVFDDIIAHGYTMYFLLESLKAYPHGDIILCASHLEESYFSPLSKLNVEYGGKVKIVTTDSVCHKQTEDYIKEIPLDDLYPAFRRPSND